MNPPCRILVVDDVATNRRTLVRALEKAGYELFEASSGNEGLQLAAARQPDLVLLDVSMPDVDGLTVCRMLKGTEGLSDVPVIFITGETDVSAMERAFAAGGSDYVTKPFHIGEVMARVAVHLQLRRMKLELEESNAQLLRAQKLESIGQLAAGIAHEINTPVQYVGDNTRFLKDAFVDILTLLKLQVEIAAEAEAGSLTPELLARLPAAAEEFDLEYLGEEIPRAIEQNLEGLRRVSTIVLAMKDFAHPGVEEFTRVDLNRAIESTATVCRNEWKYSANLDLQLDAGLPPIPCLPGEINQVLLNIIVNASHAIADANRKLGREQGQITISTRSQGDCVEIRVKDTGTGIPREIRERIFDPFFTTKGVGKGTGQGLAIAHAVVTQKHGGTIDVESEVGAGTTFVIRLPLEQEESLLREAA